MDLFGTMARERRPLKIQIFATLCLMALNGKLLPTMGDARTPKRHEKIEPVIVEVAAAYVAANHGIFII